jgi:hypothetical protein
MGQQTICLFPAFADIDATDAESHQEETRAMKQIIYAMQFRGQAGPGASPTMMKATTSSPSCTLTSVIGPEGVHGSVQPAAGGKASFESEVTVTGETSFQESGSIRFGDGNHRLRFSTVGEGYLGDSQEPKLKSGAVMWRVDSGEGQFAGAGGYITSNFTLDEAGNVIDNQFGVIFVK